MKVVCDIETDSLDATKIWCIVAKDIETGTVYSFVGDQCYNEFVDFASSVKEWWGHNFLSFDARIINKLTKANINLDAVCDTLILSRLLNSVREGGHSLDSWGTKLRYPKLPFKDFSFYTEEMLEYCKNDVELGDLVRKALLKEKETLRVSDTSVKLEHKFQTILDDMKDHGFKFKEREASILYGEINDLANLLEDKIKQHFRPRSKLVRQYTPRSNKDGSIQSRSIGPHDPSDVFVGAPYSLVEWQEFNLGSPSQVVSRLEPYWKPYVKTKSGNSWKVNEENLETLTPEAPEDIKSLVLWLTLNSRRKTLLTWIQATERDERIHGNVIGVGAATHRCTHNNPNTANITGVKDKKGQPALYGKEMRDLWTVDDGSWLVGTDASGIQLRNLGHWLGVAGGQTKAWKDYIHEMIEGDIHTKNALALGLDPKTQRPMAKTYIYAWLLGAGHAKQASILGCSIEDAREKETQFIKNTPGLEKLLEYKAILARKGWAYMPDGRAIPVESNHKSLSVLLQGLEAVIMRLGFVRWVEQVKKENLSVRPCAFVHDEWQSQVYHAEKSIAEKVGAIQVKAIEEAGTRLKLLVPYTGEFRVGKSWYETH